MASTRALSADVPDFDSIVVTGGGSGIGRGLTLDLCRSAVTVFVLGRRIETLEETRELAASLPGTVVPVVCDVRDADAVDRAFAAVEAQLGHAAQALFHGAADIYRADLVENVTLEEFDTVVSSRLRGTFIVLQRWARALIDGGLPGTGVAVTSLFGSREAPGAAHSEATTAGVEGLVRTMAREWGRHGIRVNVLGPGVFPTETLATSSGAEDVASVDDTGMVRRLRDLTALGRLGDLPEIVGPAVFLLSQAGRYITGETLVVDGGARLVDWTLVPRPQAP